MSGVRITRCFTSPRKQQCFAVGFTAANSCANMQSVPGNACHQECDKLDIRFIQ
jgi:hypothetical protein